MIDMISQEEREELLCDSERLKTCNKKKQWTKENILTSMNVVDGLLIAFLDENEEIDCDSDIVHFLGKYNRFIKREMERLIK